MTQKTNKIKKSLSILFINIILILAIVVIYLNFNYKPSKSIIRAKIENEFKYNLALKSYLIDNELSKYIEGAKSMSSRSMIRNKIVDFKNKKISLEELIAYTTPKYFDGINALDACSCAARFVDGKPIVAYGDSTSFDVLTILKDTVLNKLTTKLTARDSDFIVSTISPIIDNNTTLGYDIIYFKSSSILNIIQGSNEEFKIIEAGKDEIQSMDFKADTLIYKNGDAYFLYKSKFTDATYSFSKPKKMIFEELEDFDNRQFLVLSLLIISIILIIYIVRQRIRLFYFKRSQYLEDLVDKRTSDLNNAIEELKTTNESLQKHEKQLLESNQTKDKFFSIIAHDLINPFNSILGFLEVLNTNFDGYDRPKQKQLLGFIYKDVQNTYSLLENLLSWSRSQRGKLKFRPKNIEIAQMVNEVIDVLGIQANHKSITIESDIKDNPVAFADKDMLLTIMRNLISNAIKFTHSNGKIKISAIEIVDEASNKLVQISVKDNGVGIQPERLSTLFSISENKSTKGTERESGTGLGLLLCKDFIDKHNGKIWAESKLDEGSTFIFTIPAGEKNLT